MSPTSDFRYLLTYTESIHYNSLGMKIKRHVKTGLIFFTWGFLVGMAGSPHFSYLQKEVTQLLEKMASDYSSGDYQAVLSHVDQDFENLDEFKDGLQNEFVNKKELQLKFYVDNILEDRDLLFVGLHWLKKYRSQKGNIIKGKGSSNFIFRRGTSGYKLLFIRGDNPFY